MAKYILDTNVFGKFKDASFSLDIFDGHRVFVTSIQKAELMAIPDFTLRDARLKLVEEAKIHVMQPVSFAFDIEGRGFDQGYWFRSDILTVLQKYDREAGAVGKSQENQEADVELLMAAIHFGAVVVTQDGPFRKTIEHFKKSDKLTCVRLQAVRERWLKAKRQ